MEGLPNRQQRRLMAKNAGLLKKKSKSSFKEKLEISRRASEFGKSIHHSNVERVLREQDKAQQDLEQKKINDLIQDGKTPEEALEIVQKENNA